MYVNIPLGAISLAGASVSSVATALTKKYQKKLAKFAKLANIITSVLAVFGTSISKALNGGKIDKWEFATFQTLHLGVLNELANVDRKTEAETRAQLQKSAGGDQ